MVKMNRVHPLCVLLFGLMIVLPSCLDCLPIKEDDNDDPDQIFYRLRDELYATHTKAEMEKIIREAREFTIDDLDSIVNYFGGIDRAVHSKIFTSAIFWIMDPSGRRWRSYDRHRTQILNRVHHIVDRPDTMSSMEKLYDLQDTADDAEMADRKKGSTTTTSTTTPTTTTTTTPATTTTSTTPATTTTTTAAAPVTDSTLPPNMWQKIKDTYVYKIEKPIVQAVDEIHPGQMWDDVATYVKTGYEQAKHEIETDIHILAAKIKN